MKRKVLLMFCMFVLLASFASAAHLAKIVRDNTAPDCIGIDADCGDDCPIGAHPYCNVLNIKIDDDVVTNTITQSEETVIEPNTEYTLSFNYRGKTDADQFQITVEENGEPIEDFPPEILDGTLLGPHEWPLFVHTFKTSEAPTEITIEFSDVDSPTEFRVDNLQLVKAPEYTKYTEQTFDNGCCPVDFCWLGKATVTTDDETGNQVISECVHDRFYMESYTMPPLGANAALIDPLFLNAPNGFRCIDGEWKFSRAKYDPLYEKAGYCPYDDQCFAGADHETPCVDHNQIEDFIYSTSYESDSKETYYCYDGNWTTRTKEIALQMLKIADEYPNEPYTIFCDTYKRSLNPDEFGGVYRDYFGDDVTSILESGNINEVCVLRINGQVIAGVALNQPINEPIVGETFGSDVLDEGEEGSLLDEPEESEGDGEESDEESAESIFVADKTFIEMLKGSHNSDYCDLAVESGSQGYISCDSDDVYYNPTLMTVIFTKPHDAPRPTTPQSVPRVIEDRREDEPNLIGGIIQALKNILNSILSIIGIAGEDTDLNNLNFIQRASSFDKIYLSFDPDGEKDRYIRALIDTRAQIYWTNPDDHTEGEPTVERKTVLSAEYENYQSDICRFFRKHLPDNYETIRSQIANNGEGISCTPVILENDPDSWMHSIYIEGPVLDNPEVFDDADIAASRIWGIGADSFWNDITANIRTQVVPIIDGTNPSINSIITNPESSQVQGYEVMFTVDVEDSDNVAAVTWDFGDGTAASSYNFERHHTYYQTGSYDVEVCVMSKQFKISCMTTTYEVNNDLSIVAIPIPQETDDFIEGNQRFNFEIRGGTPPYTFHILDWGDESEIIDADRIDSTSENFIAMDHVYDLLSGESGEYTITFNANDRSDIDDPASFTDSITVTVRKS